MSYTFLVFFEFGCHPANAFILYEKKDLPRELQRKLGKMIWAILFIRRLSNDWTLDGFYSKLAYDFPL